MIMSGHSTKSYLLTISTWQAQYSLRIIRARIKGRCLPPFSLCHCARPNGFLLTPNLPINLFQLMSTIRLIDKTNTQICSQLPKLIGSRQTLKSLTKGIWHQLNLFFPHFYSFISLSSLLLRVMEGRKKYLMHKYRQNSFRVNTVINFINVLSSCKLQSPNPQSSFQGMLASA